MLGYSTHNYWKNQRIGELPQLPEGYKYITFTRTVEAGLEILNRRASEAAGQKDEKKETAEKLLQSSKSNPTSPHGERAKFDKTRMFALTSQNRNNDWVGKTLSNKELVENLKEGLVTKVRVEKHEFRDRNKELELSDAPMMVKKYNSSNQLQNSKGESQGRRTDLQGHVS